MATIFEHRFDADTSTSTSTNTYADPDTSPWRRIVGPRPRQLTTAAVLALVSAGITAAVTAVLLSIDPATSDIDPDALASVKSLAWLSLGLAALYVVGAVQALRGRSTQILIAAAALVMVTNLVASVALGGFNPLGFILPIVVITKAGSGDAAAWVQAKGGRTFGG